MENAVYILKVKCTEFDDGINEGMRTIHGWLEWDLSEWNVIYWDGEDWGKSKFLGDGMSKDFELGYINYQLDSCGSQSLRWPPTIPTFDLLIFISLCSLRPSTSSVVPGLVSVINRTWKKCWCVCASVSHHLPWGTSAATLQTTLRRGPHGEELRAPANSRVNQLGSGLSWATEDRSLLRDLEPELATWWSCS